MAEKDDAEKRSTREESVVTPMKPWEQHACVISIPRFDYAAPAYLLQRSHSGFLVTCAIKREKSATKEVMSILQKHLGSFSESFQRPDNVAVAKRQKLSVNGDSIELEKGFQSKGCIAEYDEGENVGSSDPRIQKQDGESTRDLSLVKLTGSGLLLLTLSSASSTDTTDIVSNIFQSLESSGLKLPVWCHRIFPIQATCNLKGGELRETISKLVRQFLNNKDVKLSNPLKFAAGYNRRGLEEAQTNSVDASKNPNIPALLDRTKCFEVVAAGVKDVVSDSVVDLKSPELCVLVELLPIAGVPDGSLVSAVSVLPQKLVSIKPRLCIRPLSDAKRKSGKS